MFNVTIRVSKGTRRWWTPILSDLENEIRQEIIRQKLVYTGRMLESVKTRTINPGFLYRIIVDVPYARIHEFGARSVSADYEEILEWVKRVKGESGEKAERAAWRIISALYKRGIKGKFFVKKAIKRFIRKYKSGGGL